MQFDVYCNMEYQVFQKHIAWYNFFTIFKKRQKERKKIRRRKLMIITRRRTGFRTKRKKNETKLIISGMEKFYETSACVTDP